MTREEAIEVIKAKADYLESDKRFRAAVETIIPELAESEDERIRKELIEFIQWSIDRHFMREDFHQAKRPSEWIAYLEKQKETGINWIKSDNVKNPDKPYIDKAGMFYTTDGRMCYASEIEKQKEQKPVDDKAFEEWIDGWWKEHKEKAYPQITMDEKEFKNFCRGIRNMYAEQKSVPISCNHENGTQAEWREEDEDFINMLILHFNYLIDKGGDSVETYKSYIKKLKSLRPIKQEWNEKDEKMFQESLTDIIYAKNELNKKGCEGLAKSALNAFNWLNTRFKYLRPSWKPSEEQMMALKALNLYGGLTYAGQQDQLISLYQDLQKRK